MERTQRQFCLDMIKVGWVGADGFKKADCAIILEIEPTGGLVQTTVLALVQGRVTSCEEDAYGFIVNFAINDKARNWFPEYVPPFLHSAGGC